MTVKQVGRRSVIAGLAASLSGCLGRVAPGGRSIPTESDGYPPSYDRQPERRRIDTGAFPRLTVHGVDVPLAPVDVTYYWHRRGEARFVDARGQRSYELSHILGAVLSPAPDGGEDDPVVSWPRADRIVCYCGCPHHLSSLRAASLIADGYERVFVIDEGFWEWRERGYPIAGRAVLTQPEVYVIEGRTDPEYAGQTVWVWHEPSNQREATTIGEDGTYVLELRFTGVTSDSEILIETPGYRVRGALRTFLRGTVTGGQVTSSGRED